MYEIAPDRPTGPWQHRVRFGPDGSFAYRPGEVLVSGNTADLAEDTLREWVDETDGAFELRREEGLIAEAFTRFTGTFEPKDAIDRLHGRGVLAQVNHVLFATACCPPHPSSASAKEFYEGFEAKPFYAHGVTANPFYAHGFDANPFYAHSGGGCCSCDCCGSVGANPFYAHGFDANPFYAHAPRSPFVDRSGQHSGARRSSARPADRPQPKERQPVDGVRVAILDTGWAETNAPTGIPGFQPGTHGGDQPDEDRDGFVDPAAGHGTFIAGVIEQLAPGCQVDVIEVLSTYGDGDEAEVARILQTMAGLPDDQRPHLVNLSFGGYSPVGMAVLAAAIRNLHEAGSVVVASAGNDGTCVPLFPAALPHVVGVGAVDADGKPAKFTNYGPWVRACAQGVDLVSLFFEGFDGAGPPEKNYDPDRFDGWAKWSGTSFAAPGVVAALARAIGKDGSAHAALARVIDGENLPRRPMLGTLVDLDW